MRFWLRTCNDHVPSVPLERAHNSIKPVACVPHEHDLVHLRSDEFRNLRAAFCDEFRLLDAHEEVGV